MSHRSGELLQATVCLDLREAALVRPSMAARAAEVRMLDRNRSCVGYRAGALLRWCHGPTNGTQGNKTEPAAIYFVGKRKGTGGIKDKDAKQREEVNERSEEAN